MIRGFSGRITLVLFLVALVQSSEFQKLQITKATRLVNLASGYAAESIKISFVSNDEGITHFSYLLPTEYDQKISKIWFTKSEKDRSTLSYTKKIASHGKIAYSEYKVTLPSKSNIGDLGNIHVHITYLYRYVNLPASITLTEDQKLQYEDVKFIISPYHVLEQETIYKMHKVLDVEQDGVKKSMGEVAFTKSSIEPFTVFRHTVFGVNNSPLVQFTEVERVIDVSHWGNVGIVEHYKILNKGPQLKGQFSRVTFGSRGDSVKNSFKGIEFDLPSEIWGLYYLDQVGNISTSRAFRDNSKQVVHVGLTPRFALLGGWKSNWQIGYNFNTLGHLFHSGSRFQLKNIKLEYALQRILAEHYTIKVILPDGAHNARIKIGGHVYDSSSLQVGRSEGYLDFNGRPTYIIPNYRGNLADKNIEVEYDYDQTKVYEKIIILIVIVLVFLGSAILAKRFKLEAFESSKQD